MNNVPALSRSNEVKRYTANTPEELGSFVNFLVQTKAVPRGFMDKEGNVKQGELVIAIMAAAEIGRTPSWALMNMCVVNGIATVYGDGIMALIHDSGLLSEMNIEHFGEGDNTGVSCTMARKDTGVSHTGRFTKAMAMKAKLLGKYGPWINYPSQMMERRAVGLCARYLFADVLQGVKAHDEVIEYAGDAEQVRTVSDPLSDDIPVQKIQMKAEPPACIPTQDEIDAPSIQGADENFLAQDMELIKSMNDLRTLGAWFKDNGPGYKGDEHAKLKATYSGQVDKIINQQATPTARTIENDLRAHKTIEALDKDWDAIKTSSDYGEMDFVDKQCIIRAHLQTKEALCTSQ